jgi:hypothetical protein
VQWDGSEGWEEYRGRPNQPLTSLSAYQRIVDAWQVIRDEDMARASDPYFGMTLEQKQAAIEALIVAEEDRRSWLPIEHPSLSGVFHKVTEAISNTKERLRGMTAGDALPINNGCWDDVDGVPVAMTYGGLCDLWNAIFDRAAMNYGVRKYHVTEMKKLSDPATYDFSGGWA